MRWLTFCVFASILISSCALHTDDVSVLMQEKKDVCTGVAFESTRTKMIEVNTLRSSKQYREAAAAYDDAYELFLQDEVQYNNLTFEINNLRTMLINMKPQIALLGNAKLKKDANLYYKNAENKIKVCDPEGAREELSQLQLLLDQ